MGRKLKSYAWAMSGNMAYALSQWALVIALNFIGGIEVVGRYALALAFVSPIMMLMNLGLRNVLAVDVRNEHAFLEYLWLRVLTAVGGGAILSASVWLLYSREVSLVVMALSLYKVLESVSDIFNGYQQKELSFRTMSSSLLLKACACLFGTVLVYSLTRNLALGVLVSAILMAGVVGFDLRAYRGLAREPLSLRQPGIWHRVMGLAIHSLPMGIVVFLISLNTNITRYVAHGNLGETGLGVFSAVAYFVVAGNLIVGSISQVLLPQLASSHQGRALDVMQRIKSWAGVSLLVGGVLGVSAWGLGDLVLKLIYGQVVAANNQNGLIWMSGILALTYFIGMLNNLVNALKSYFMLLASSSVAVIFNLSLSWWLIPDYGLVGAYMAWSSSLFLQALLLVLLIQWRQKYAS